MKKYNNFLPSQNARWCTIEMKLKSFEKLDKTIFKNTSNYCIGIRYDEEQIRCHTNNLIKPKFPFIEDQINKENVIEILENAGLGLPDYYSWRSRSGCSFCFFQRRIEWVGLLENHPEKFAYAKSLEKLAKDNKSPFTWIKDLPLEDLEKPESIKKIKEHHQKKLERLKTKKSKDIETIHS